MRRELWISVALCAGVLAVQPNSIAGYNLGNLLRGQGWLAEAIAVYRESLRYRGRDPKLYNKLGAALEASGDLDGARLQCGISVKLDPSYEIARRNLARASEPKGAR